ncbi:hypothetical protein M2103_001317 [Ereboglobus sp. PH5-5]|uniref:hypothetical protein n=1 Tax=Ereboglobus sp. PH5-5 TaxID=2940529 RepID=UPI0024050CEA|nr:hypothetical protein [Ereboglobus sp. PH5-5]MDF9833100.1 hypothetical protein [Ereboglobus sp. PH5-5]
MKNPDNKYPRLPRMTIKQAISFKKGLTYSVVDRWLNEGLIPLIDSDVSNPRARRFFRADFLRFLCSEKAKSHQQYPVRVALTEIEIRDNMRLRAEVNGATVDDYAASLDRGDKLPPILAMRVEGTLVNLDGEHLCEAHKCRNKRTIMARIIEPCTRAEGLYLALKGNNAHGLALSAADKTKTCLLLYGLPEYAQLSHYDMGCLVKCSHMTAARAFEKLHGVGRRGKIAKDDPLRREKRIFSEIRTRVRTLAKQAGPILAIEMETTIKRWESQLFKTNDSSNTDSTSTTTLT